MNRKISPISRNDLIKKLKVLGWDGPYKGGKHWFMIKSQQRLIIPNPHRKDIGVDLLRRILRQANISHEEWIKI